MNAYWQSLESSVSSDQEFASTPLSDQENMMERRDFLKLMGASLALTSMSCIRRPVEKIVPYANRPEEIEPGIANYYCSTYTSGGEGQSIVVKTREGRPIYLTGNSDTPSDSKGLSLQAQAHILDLYHPDRLRHPYRPGRKQKPHKFVKATWEELDVAVTEAFKSGPVGLLTGSLSSPSSNTLIRSFLGESGRHYRWDVLGGDDVMEGQEACFGQSLVPDLKFDKAKIIVSVAADFLGTWLAPAHFSSLFAKGRKPGNQMSKLIVFEALHSLTGANADVRLRVPPSRFLNVVMALIYEIVVKNKRSSFANQPQVLSVLNRFSAIQTGVDPALISQLAVDLWDHRGESLVVSGGLTARTEQAGPLQIATNFLNTVLDNEGQTIDIDSALTSFNGSYSDLEALTEDLNRGRLKTLIISGVNPWYNAPSAFRPALTKAKEAGTVVVYLSDQLNETATVSDWIAPLSHQMESWGDAQLFRGFYSVQQPTIRPLYDTRCLEENLLTWQKLLTKPVEEEPPPEEEVVANETKPQSDWYVYLREQWKIYHQEVRANWLQIPPNFEDFWLETLHKGFALNRFFNVKSNPSRSFRIGSLAELLKAEPVVKAEGNDLELSLYVKATMGDGRQAHNVWLQETPDPITKVVWDNYLVISPLKAKELGFTKSGQQALVQSETAKVTVPVLILPGVQDQTVGLALGYGRWQWNKTQSRHSVGSDVGQSVYPFMEQDVFSGLKVSVKKVEGWTDLAGVQGHHRMMGRQIVVEATLKEYLKSPSAHIHRHKLFSLYPKHEYKGHRWAMAIDLNACIGCSACMVACQSENNVPSVGKKYVLQGREMHWIRIDRYYTGSESDPDVVFQPMLCQHCENASCEAVCPVVATVHGEEGLNQMIYNRCVGTRYCSNNCPYKVRRFNWFNYSKVADSLKGVYNPNVTVRTRGVMEKCTFCTQRIKEAKVLAKRDQRRFRGEDVVTACQEACPTSAIVFGDVNDPDSQVSRVFQDERTFGVLEEYNNVPMVRYQTKLRNTDHLKSEGSGGHHS